MYYCPASHQGKASMWCVYTCSTPVRAGCCVASIKNGLGSLSLSLFLGLFFSLSPSLFLSFFQDGLNVSVCPLVGLPRYLSDCPLSFSSLSPALSLSAAPSIRLSACTPLLPPSLHSDLLLLFLLSQALLVVGLSVHSFVACSLPRAMAGSRRGSLYYVCCTCL